MREANLVLGMIFLGYLVFTTMNGNLIKWLQALGIK